MNPSDIPSSSQTIIDSTAAARLSVKVQRVSTRSSGLRSSSHSAKLSRNSSTTRSIKIFADVRDLLGIHGSSHVRLPDHIKSETGFRSPSISVHESISSTGRRDSVAPDEQDEPTPSAVQLEHELDLDTRQPCDHKEQSTDASISLPEAEPKIGSTSPSLYESFPRPPAQVVQSDHHRSIFAPYEKLCLSREEDTTSYLNCSISEKRPPRVDKLLPQPPYHSFTRKKKLMVVILVSLAGSLSPLSSTIYFPALNTIAAYFHVSKELVILTITAFMLVQGITPVLRMPFESVGRRPVLIGTLFVFSGASIGLVYTRRFVTLIVLRAVQAGGSAALTAIGTSVIGDISTAKERGDMMGILSAVLIGSHFISPVIGGTLTHFLGFRSIFWVLFIFAAAIMVSVILLLPETLRSIAGNGTVKLGLIHRPFWSIFKSRDTPFNPASDAPSSRPSLTALIEPFNCLRHKNVVASIIFGSFVYGVWAAVITTTTILFQPRFHLSTLLVGVAFLPSGAGSVLSFYLTGYIMDRDYRIVELHYRNKHNIDSSETLDPKSLPNFPIYRARLRSLWWIALIFIATTASYGFSFLADSIAIPLVLQFFVAFSATAVLFLNGVLVADTYPGCSASVIAIMNLIRFSYGALTVGTVQLLFNRIGIEFTFLTSAMAVVAVMPILLVQWFIGSGTEHEDTSWWKLPSRFSNFAV